MVTLTRAAARTIEVEAFTSLPALEGLREAWFDLWRRCPNATPFQTPEWLLPWWRHLGGGELDVLAFRVGGRLAGVAPLFYYHYQGRRQVSPLGIGVSDYLGCLFEPGFAPVGAALLLRHLERAAGRWDVADFPDLPVHEALLAAGLPEAAHVQLTQASVCPVLHLPASAADYDGHLPARHRRNLRRAERLLAEAGPAQFETATPGTLPEYLDALFALHGRRWAAHDQPGMLADEAVRAFHREALPGLLARGAACLYGLRLHGRLVAVLYVLLGAQCAYAYLGGFEPGLSRASPGTLLTRHAIQRAIERGLRAYDFLRGRETHKLVWGAGEQATYRLLLWHPPAEALVAPLLAARAGQ